MDGTTKCGAAVSHRQSLLVSFNHDRSKTMKIKDVVQQRLEAAWDHGSCFLHCLTTTVADKNLPDVIQSEMFTDDVMFNSPYI